MRPLQIKALFVTLGALFLLALLPGIIVNADFGVNWTAEFFNSTDLTGTVVTTQSYPSGINMNWGNGKPLDSAGNVLTTVNEDNFSVRFTSFQTFAQGNYQFVASSDDGVRVFIDDVLVLDQFVARPLTTNSFNRDMTAGQHKIVVEYVEFAGGAIVQFQWFLQGGVTQTVAPGTPGTVLPTTSPIPAVTASVVTVRGLSLRTGPYLGASMIGVARPGTAYTVHARNMDEGIFTWYLITVGEKTGWSSGRYLQITGDVSLVPVTPTEFDQIDGAPDVGVRAFPRAVMNFRRRPSIRSERIGQIPWGAETILIGRTVQAGLNTWFQVRYNGVVGWIYAPYITVSGPIEAVPIR